MKRCSKCKIEKPFEQFSKNKSKKDGYSDKCKSCIKQYYEENKEKLIEKQKEYYEENKEKILEYAKQYREENRDNIAEYKKQHYKENKEKLSEYGKQYREENKDKICEQQKQYREENKDKISEYGKQYREENKDKITEYKKQHYEKNKDKYSVSRAKRRANKLQATPSWLTAEHHQEILNIYKLRQEVSEETGILHHVDHIVPLQGETVCGLHVPWNLRVIPAEENLSKNNKFDEELLEMLDIGQDLE